MNDNNKRIIEYYKNTWPYFIKLWNVNETYCIHYGYCENGINTHIKSVNNMNNYVERLLQLNSLNGNPIRILDAGCGIGGTIVYLAKKHPKNDYFGITIIPNHIALAKQHAQMNKVLHKTKFELQDYLDTDFPSNYFNAVFALESLIHTQDHSGFLREMYRILKPNGKLIIIDAFRTNIQLNNTMNNILYLFCRGKAIPDLIDIEKFKSIMNQEGFAQIENINLTKNVRRSIIRGNILSTPYLAIITTKKILKRRYNVVKDPMFPIAVSLFSTIIGLKKGITYNSITAVKNE